MKIWSCILPACGFLYGALCAQAALAQTPTQTPTPTAVFDFGLIDTSLQAQDQGPRAIEQTRLASLDAQLREALVRSGCCELVDVVAVAQQAQGVDIWRCNGCDVDFARKAGAKLSVSGWVQKVSNLILNINLSVHDTTTGKMVSAGSVDIRGNTDESWSRGLAYLLQNKLHPAQWR
jgi:hypothetical protein